MSTRYNLDRESFEHFLANAHAVQESGLDPRSLSALVEIQQFIANGEFDLDQAMRKIADRVHTLLGASGVALALLDANELVYHAGAGSSTKDVGRHVLAVLNVSSSEDMRREILRVEDAETDTRIQAEICRQFGAKSLVMLPICENHALLGVLQVHFSDPHAFLDNEIRICRLMIGALEAGMLRRLQGAETREMKPRVEEKPVHQHDSARPALAGDQVTVPTVPAASTENVVQELARTNPNDRLPSVPPEHSHVYASVLIHEKNSLWTRFACALRATVNRSSTATFSRAGFAVTAALMMAAITSLSGIHHPTSKSFVVTTRPDTTRTVPAAPVSANEEANLLVDAPRESMKRGTAFRRVMVAPNEVDYIADDVTIRRFTTVSPKSQIRSGVKEVNFGDDVTVRYFTNNSATLSRPAGRPDLRPTTTHPASVPR